MQPNIVILTGAGISAESGLQTFRAEDGLWCNHRVEDVATPEGFARDPKTVHEFYNMRRAQLADVEPNAAHRALAELEQAWPGAFLLVTQNVDNLHARAGSRQLLPMHGELTKVRCVASGQVWEWKEALGLDSVCGCCGVAGNLRPHIVWFGEMPLQMQRIGQALRHADYFLSIGTSGQVYPAAGFVQEVLDAGGYTVELNLEPSRGSSFFDETHYGPATQVVPSYVSQLLKEVL